MTTSVIPGMTTSVIPGSTTSVIPGLTRNLGMTVFEKKVKKIPTFCPVLPSNL